MASITAMPSSSSLTIEVDASQFPDVTRNRLIEAINTRRLPGRFLYDSPAQAARWLRYHSVWSPSRTETELLHLYDQAFDFALSEFKSAGTNHLQYISLGCGGGSKDKRLVERAAAASLSITPTLTDTSPSLVVGAVNHVAHPGGRGIVIDLEQAPLKSAFSTSEAPSLWTAFGMVPNLNYTAFIQWLRDTLSKQDLAIISANLSPQAHPNALPLIIPQYDNLEARSWYYGALRELGLGEVELDIRGNSLVRDGSIWRVEVTATLAESSTVYVYDQRIDIPAEEPLEVFFSNRFTPDAFERVLTQQDLKVQHRWLFEGEQEGIWVVSL